MKAYEMGRLAAHWCEVGSETALCWNMYGWTGAGTINLDTEKSNEAAQRTDDMCQIIHEETHAHPNVLSMICTDLNARAEDMPTMNHMVQ